MNNRCCGSRLPTLILIALALSLTASAQTPRAAAATAAAAVPTGAVEAVRSFYRSHFAHDKTFTRANIKRRRPWLTPELYTLLIREYHREEVESAKHPDQSVFVEGDPFTNSQEHPDSFRAGRAAVRGSQARVPVTLFRSNGAELRTAIIEVKRRGRTWLVHNIISAGDDDDLLKLLRRRLQATEAHSSTR